VTARRTAPTPPARSGTPSTARGRGASAYVPDRGHVVWLDFDPQAGHEQATRRPAVVLSPASYNGVTSLALCCPVTSQVKDYPFEVAMPAGGKAQGVALADQVRSLHWRARNAAYLDTLPTDAVDRILARARALLS
jgi:mRNA interferase MazF